MEKRELEIGDVVQLNPDHVKFPGFFVVVTEPKSFGCQGYLMSAYNFEACKFMGRAFVRPKFKDFEYVGKIVWDADILFPEDEVDKE
jgi:hypothetical protein